MRWACSFLVSSLSRIPLRHFEILRAANCVKFDVSAFGFALVQQQSSLAIRRLLLGFRFSFRKFFLGCRTLVEFEGLLLLLTPTLALLLQGWLLVQALLG